MSEIKIDPSIEAKLVNLYDIGEKLDQGSHQEPIDLREWKKEVKDTEQGLYQKYNLKIEI